MPKLSQIWIIALLSLPALGQDNNALPLKGLSFVVNSEFSYDNNVLRQQDDAAITDASLQQGAQQGALDTSQTGPRLASRIWTFNPRLSYRFQRSGGDYRVSYDVMHNNYLDSKEDTYTTQILGLNGEQKFNNFNKLTLLSSYNHSYEQRGVGFNEGSNAQLLSSPTPIGVADLGANYQFGSEEGKMRLVGSIGARSTNRESDLITNDSRDFQERMFGGAMMYRVGFRTDMVVEYRQREITYPRTPTDSLGREINLDSQETQELVGLDLRATAKTTGKVRVGTIERDFKWESAAWEDQPAAAPVEEPAVTVTEPVQAPRTSGKDFFWEFAAAWAPRTYSRFEFTSRSGTRESLGIGSYIRSKDYTLSWTHGWNTRFESNLNFSVGTDVYKDSSRIDERKAANLNLAYKFGRALNTGFGYRYQQMQTNFGNLGYDKSVFYIFITYQNDQSN